MRGGGEGGKVGGVRFLGFKAVARNVIMQNNNNASHYEIKFRIPAVSKLKIQVIADPPSLSLACAWLCVCVCCHMTASG